MPEIREINYLDPDIPSPEDVVKEIQNWAIESFIESLAAHQTSPSRENQPHISLFYLRNPLLWTDINTSLEEVSQNIQISNLTYVADHIDLVSFKSDGHQEVTRFNI